MKKNTYCVYTKTHYMNYLIKKNYCFKLRTGTRYRYNTAVFMKLVFNISKQGQNLYYTIALSTCKYCVLY